MVQIQINLDVKENQLVNLHKARFDLATKEDAIKDIIIRQVQK